MLTFRQNEILDFLRSRKHAKIDEIAKHIFVSDTTVRRELNELKRLGLIDRDHGGAVILENADDISISVRQILRLDNKVQIAQMAQRELPDFKTVFLDNSSTALTLAQRMNFKNKTVVTNGITAAMQLSQKSDVNVYLLGGKLNYNIGTLNGSATVQEIEQMEFNLMLCSCTSFNARGSYESSADQRDVKRAALANSRYKILLVDDTKLNDNALYRTANLSEYDAIYTDASDEALAGLRQLPGIKIINRKINRL
ncbi:MAG: DeoR/GlpR transcriptional regulator [Lachnospiraceae bacterium]|nr:DeoR/GlpR transcriptional regulator [Lachnospiraceae bacterium]